jgi:hypothetical protein
MVLLLAGVAALIIGSTGSLRALVNPTEIVCWLPKERDSLHSLVLDTECAEVPAKWAARLAATPWCPEGKLEPARAAQLPGGLRCYTER